MHPTFARLAKKNPSHRPADPPPALSEIETPDKPKDATVRDIINEARYEDIARRLISEQPVKTIAKAHDVDPRHMRRILSRPRMREVFERVKTEIYSNLDSLIKDEKAAPLLRARAQTIRAQTLLGEIMSEVKERINGGVAKATELRVGMDTAFGVIDRSKTEIGLSHSPSTVNLELVEGTTNIFATSLRESGVNLGDIIDVKPIDESPKEEGGE